MSIVPEPIADSSSIASAPTVALTLDQVAESLQLSRPSVVALINQGRLHAIKVGRTWRISAASLDRLFEDQGGER